MREPEEGEDIRREISMSMATDAHATIQAARLRGLWISEDDESTAVFHSAVAVAVSSAIFSHGYSEFADPTPLILAVIEFIESKLKKGDYRDN